MSDATNAPAPGDVAKWAVEAAASVSDYGDWLRGLANAAYAAGYAAAEAQRPAAPDAQAAAWPTPITDRPPTEADGDELGRVLCLQTSYGLDGRWVFSNWQYTEGRPWLPAPRWRPPAPSARDAAIKALRERLNGSHCVNAPNFDAMQLALRALESGDGQ